jgi:hypothetical protein
MTLNPSNPRTSPPDSLQTQAVIAWLDHAIQRFVGFLKRKTLDTPHARGMTAIRVPMLDAQPRTGVMYRAMTVKDLPHEHL